MIGVITHQNALHIFNLIVCGEIVVAAVAQAIAFSFEPFVTVTVPRTNFLRSVGHAITVDDVIEDAQKTFLQGTETETLKMSQRAQVMSKMSSLGLLETQLEDVMPLKKDTNET